MKQNITFGIVACLLVVSIYAFWPHNGPVITYEKIWLTPNEGKKGDEVRLYVKGAILRATSLAILEETPSCFNKQALSKTEHKINFKNVGPVDKTIIDPITGQDGSRPFIIPPCVTPGRFIVETVVTALVCEWYKYCHTVIYKGPTFEGNVLP